MRYFGGKSKTANQIAGYLNNIRKPGQTYWEPFVGAGWVLERIRGKPIFASDANSYLIAMWQALQKGWIPPENVSEAEYAAAKAGEYPAHLTAFIGFACSFAAIWFGGYARSEKTRNYAKQSQQSILLKNSKIDNDTHFFYANFLECDVPDSGCLIYCDPPYENAIGYEAVGKFDSDAFWARTRWLESRGHTVVVSEYQAPDDFSCVLEMPTKTNINTKNGKGPRIEKLFRLGEHPKFQATLWDAIMPSTNKSTQPTT